MHRFSILAGISALASMSSAGFIFDDIEPNLYKKNEKLDILVGSLTS